MADRQTASLQELVADAIRDAAELARHEFHLFRSEMAENVTGIGKGVAMFAVAAVFGVASLIWLTQALVYGIDVVLHRPWLSALIVGVLLLAVAAGLAITGKRFLSASSLAPRRTVRSLKRDGEILTERTSG